MAAKQPLSFDKNHLKKLLKDVMISFMITQRHIFTIIIF